MIIDYLKNLGNYKEPFAGITEVTSFIKERNLAALKPDRYELTGGSYVNVLAYETKLEPATAVLEAHRKYIDFQYMISGAEVMLWHNLAGSKRSREYRDDDDCAFFEVADPMRLIVKSGMFCIFLPEDLHCASLFLDSPIHVKKAVFKLRLKEVYE